MRGIPPTALSQPPHPEVLPRRPTCATRCATVEVRLASPQLPAQSAAEAIEREEPHANRGHGEEHEVDCDGLREEIDEGLARVHVHVHVQGKEGGEGGEGEEGGEGGASLAEVLEGVAEAVEEIADQGGGGVTPRQHLARARARVSGWG